MTTYRVPFENGESAFTEKRSRFISHIWRVESEEEARRHAGWDVAKQAGLAFAGGGLMGFGSAAGGMAYNGAANRYAAPRAVESGSFYNAL